MVTKKIVYVSLSKDDSFTCNEKSAEIAINKAIKYAYDNAYDIVHIRSGSYLIRNPLEVYSDLTIEGDGKDKTIIKVADSIALDKNSKFYIPEKNRKIASTMVPIIWPAGSTSSKYVSAQNVTICNFQINANATGNDEIIHGKGYFNCAYFTLSTNIIMHDMKLIDGKGDGLRAANCDGVYFYNNEVEKMGHDACFCLRSNNCHSYNNTVAIRTNSGTRMNDCTNSSIHDNDVWAWANHWSAGGPGFQIERQFKSAISVDVYNNVIHYTYGPGMWVVMNSAAVAESGKSKVNIYNNTFYDCGINPTVLWTGGIIVDRIHNVVIENNVFDGCFCHGVACRGMTDTTSSSVNVTTYVRNNIVINTKLRKFSPDNTGYGIHNMYTSSHKMIVSNNCVYDNISGNYKGVTATNDINVDPLFVDAKNRNYTLKSNSQCINKGYSASDKKVNIGLIQSEENIQVDDTPKEVVEPIEDSNDKIVTIYPICNRLKEKTPGTVLKSDQFMDVGAIGTSKYRSLLSFDLSEYYNKNVKSAILSLYWYFPDNKTRANDTVVEIYSPMRFTTEHITWDRRNLDFNWINTGGNWVDKNGNAQGAEPFTSIKFDKSTVPTNSVYNIDVTDLIQKYVSGFYDNTGFLIKSKIETDDYIAFYNSNIMATNKKMKLTIEYSE